MNSPTILLFVGVLAFGAGFLIAWHWSAGRERNQKAKELLEIETRLRSEAEKIAGLLSTVAELRPQIDEIRKGADENRTRLEQEQVARAQAETALENERASLQEQRRLLSEAEGKLSDAFRALASKALQVSNEEFLRLAESKFQTLREQATSDLTQRQQAISGLVTPLNETLHALQERLSEAESARTLAYGELRTQVQQLAQTENELRQETGNLVGALRRPQTKGTWGQLTLRRAVELAGMSKHCDFSEQVFVKTEDGRLIPDMVVHLPNGRQIVVDAKAPLQAFTEAASAKTAEEHSVAMEKHARLVRAHVQHLSSKAYWTQFEPTPEFVVCFLPGESYFSAALEQDSRLIEDAMEQRVVLSSPTTLIALLRAVAYGWRQEELSKNAEQISEYGKDLYDKVVRFLKYMEDIRAGLERANAAYNSAIGSLEGRLIPSARRFTELGVSAAEELPAVSQTEVALRQPTTTMPDERD